MKTDKFLKIVTVISVAFVLFSLSACITPGLSVKKEETPLVDIPKDTIYTFDEIPSEPTDTTTNINITENSQDDQPVSPKPPTKGFTLQIGAFSSLEKADEFAALHRKKIPDVITVYYSDQVKLFVVQLLPLRSRAEAERRKNELWQIEDYKDAFLIEVAETQ